MTAAGRRLSYARWFNVMAVTGAAFAFEPVGP
jgi:hypothetical protein